MLKDKMKSYNFWISLVSAVLLVARLIAGKFNVEIDSSLVMDVTTGLCGIFVVLGIISAPQKTVTKFIDRPLEGIIAQPLTDNGETKSDNNAPTATISHCEERSDVAIPVLGEEATVDSEASAPIRHCEERSDVAIPLLEENSAPLGEDGRAATEGVTSSLFTAPRNDEAETAGVTPSEKDTAVEKLSEEDKGVVIESEGNANGEATAPLGEDGRAATEGVISSIDGANQMPNPNDGANQMPVINEGINQMPNLAEFSKEQLIEIICANPQLLNAGKNSN